MRYIWTWALHRNLPRGRKLDERRHGALLEDGRRVLVVVLLREAPQRADGRLLGLVRAVRDLLDERRDETGDVLVERDVLRRHARRATTAHRRCAMGRATPLAANKRAARGESESLRRAVQSEPQAALG